jgi:hypothetical protein
MPDPSMTQLRALMDFAERGGLPPDITAWLLPGGYRYIAAGEAGAAVGLDVALGLGRPGRHGWWIVEARENRDAFLCEFRQRDYAHLNDAEAAREIAALARRKLYFSSDPRLLAALKLGLRVPDAKQLRAIFRKSAGV